MDVRRGLGGTGLSLGLLLGIALGAAFAFAWRRFHGFVEEMEARMPKHPPQR